MHKSLGTRLGTHVLDGDSSIDGGYWMDFQPFQVSINSMNGPTKSACNLDQGLVGHFHARSGGSQGED